MTRAPRRRSIRTKLNILVIGNILAVAAGLMAISFYVFCQRVDERYYQQLERAATACANNVESGMVRHFVQVISSEDFKNVRESALAANDEQIISDWLESQPGWYQEIEAEVDAEEETDSPDKDLSWTLKDDYQLMIDSLEAIEEFLSVDSAYYQYEVNNTTYNIADYGEDLFYIGSIENPIEFFENFPDNGRIAPCAYHSEFGWLYSAIEPIEDPETGEAFAIAGVDINMTEIVNVRYQFLQQCIAFVILLLMVAVVSVMLLMKKTVVHPLRSLADAAKGFAKDDHVFSKDDVIQLDIRSNDEVSDLYNEIRSMESRIVDYTENLTLITAEKEKVNAELRTASHIQESMLPRIFPPFPDRRDFDLYASMTPAKEVGGDFYDFFFVDEDHLALVIADVSDKGVPAALFMMASKIILNYRVRLGGTPSEILKDVNIEICKTNTSKMFVTVWLGILDLKTGIMTCANAGHEYPVIRGKDGVFHVVNDPHGLVVGAMPRSKYRDYEISLQSGDAVFLYTDGVPEANNAAGDFYGMQRLEDALNRAGSQSPQGILEAVKADVDGFTGNANQFDDLTMLCLEYRGSAS